MKMSLLKLSKKELCALTSTKDVWQVFIGMKEMLDEIENVDLTVHLSEVDRFTQLPTGFTLDVKRIKKNGAIGTTILKQSGNAPATVSKEVNQVALLAKLINKAIKEINEEGYFINKKLIKKLDKVLYFAREYLKGYSEACSSGSESKWVDDVVAELEWTPNANLRVLAMLKAAKKMEKALEGVKEHLVIDPFKEDTVGDKSVVNVSFGRLSGDIDLATQDENAQMLANLILSPISIYLGEECPDLPEKERRRIQQSRVAVLALTQIRPPQTEAFKAINQAILAVMMA
jgi:hypothetical protein